MDSGVRDESLPGFGDPVVATTGGGRHGHDGRRRSTLVRGQKLLVHPGIRITTGDISIAECARGLVIALGGQVIRITLTSSVFVDTRSWARIIIETTV